MNFILWWRIHSMSGTAPNRFWALGSAPFSKRRRASSIVSSVPYMVRQWCSGVYPKGGRDENLYRLSQSPSCDVRVRIRTDLHYGSPPGPRELTTAQNSPKLLANLQEKKRKKCKNLFFIYFVISNTGKIIKQILQFPTPMDPDLHLYPDPGSAMQPMWITSLGRTVSPRYWNVSTYR